MKRSEQLAWTSLAALLAIAAILLTGGIMFNGNIFWAGMMLALGQSLVVGLAAWGLRLARQRAELEDTSPAAASQGFRMSYGEESAPTTSPAAREHTETKTLDTGFQRLLVTLAAIVLLAFSAVISYVLVYRTFAWVKANPELPFPVAGLDKPELALLIALAAAAIYTILYSITRVRRDTVGTAEAVNSNFTLGLPAVIALGIAAICGYFHAPYAAEFAASLTAALLALQGLELLLNAFRSYSAIEELDQQAIDLQSLPLIPMLSSVWLSGVKLLFAQSVGLSQTKEKSVLGRMMPRALAALVIIAILVSCLRVVRPGRVAILERLGEPQKNADGSIALLRPGLHFTCPYPIDILITIPTDEIQLTNVGAELHAPKGADKRAEEADFRFWTVRDVAVNETEDAEDQFATGDPTSPQLLETFVTVLWRVKEPAKFYNRLSHAVWFKENSGEAEPKSLPIYQEIVQQCASFAVTRTFAIHSLDEIMITSRREVEDHCRLILQDKLAEKIGGLDSGIEIINLTIKDLHPPLGIGKREDMTAPFGYRFGPAHAYENVTSQREVRETLKNMGEAYKIVQINLAKGAADAEISKAIGYRAEKVARAQGEAARMLQTMSGIDALPESERRFVLDLAERSARYRALKDVLTPVSKILVDPSMKEGLTFIQNTKDKNVPTPTGPPG